MGIVKSTRSILSVRLQLHQIAVILGLILFLSDFSSLACISKAHTKASSVSFETIYEESLVGFYMLAKNKKKWKDLTPEGKQRMQKKYMEWQSLSKEEQKVLRQRMDRLEKMSPKERQFFNKLFKRWQHISPEDRRKLEKDLKNWKHLTPKQQDSIRRRFLD